LVGYDQDDTERVLIEAKFWAGLTNNQPNTYLERLHKDLPSVLIFVAPEARVETLWPEILRLADKKHNVKRVRSTSDIRTALVDQGPSRLMITSWRNLLNRIGSDLEQPSLHEDLRQLMSLVNQQDTHEFVPFGNGELGPNLARRIYDIGRLVDAVIEKAAEEEVFIDPNRRGISGRRGIYGRWLSFSENIGVWFGMYWQPWAKRRDTPLWLEINSVSGIGDAELRRRLKPLKRGDSTAGLYEANDGYDDGHWYIPIDVPVGREFDPAVDEIVQRLRRIRNLIFAEDDK
jgi:hypothetical protein